MPIVENDPLSQPNFVSQNALLQKKSKFALQFHSVLAGLPLGSEAIECEAVLFEMLGNFQNKMKTICLTRNQT